MSTVPVLKCKHCGRPVLATHVETYGDDNGVMLHNIMAHLGEIAYCNDCLNARNYYLGIGRLSDWEAGNV